MTAPISTSSDWTFELIEQYDRELARIAADFGLDTYPVQIEIISAEQMMDAYSSVGMPVGYNHWSFGKQFLHTMQSYSRGQMGLAYEIVINSNPCICYLMEENTMMMQALVTAHAGYGHNSFFKNNYLFRTWTDASAIIDYLLFAKSYVSECEERYGLDAVEAVLDACHALMNHGVDRYKRPSPISAGEERRRQEEREAIRQHQLNDLWRTIPDMGNSEQRSEGKSRFPSEPQENILYFIEKNAPLLETWQRELVRIVRKTAQYFYPQRQTQVMNEGWASFWHYTLIHQLYAEGLVTDGFMLEFLESHSAVVYQPPFDSPYYSGLNPYTLGFSIFTDLKRICQEPTEEDQRWFPDIAGSDWLATLDFAMRNFKDESFILQYLSPKVIRDLKLFAISDDEKEPVYEITAIHNDHGYRAVREKLARQYNLSYRDPDIQVWNVDVRGDRTLTLRHNRTDGMPLGPETREVLRHVHQLWGFPVCLQSVDEELIMEEERVPDKINSEQAKSA
ncbi:MAG: SpoVR family protein [Halomonadaceae bacterium]|nr:MAG: SpoVR family protein [Halomonadaceae bacterium]